MQVFASAVGYGWLLWQAPPRLHLGRWHAQVAFVKPCPWLGIQAARHVQADGLVQVNIVAGITPTLENQIEKNIRHQM